MSFPTHVMIATDTTVQGGVDRYVVDLALAGGTAGAAVTVLLERAAEPGLGETLARHGVPVVRRRLHHGSHDAADIASECRAVIAELEPDLLHVVCGSPRSCLTLRETASTSAVPIVLTEQYVSEDLTFTAETVSRIERSYRSASHVIFVSDGNRDEMARLIPDAAPPTHVIPNAVSVKTIAARSVTPRDRRERTAARLAAGALRVMCVARLTSQKGIDVLLRAVCRLGPGSGTVVDVFGAGPLRDQLLAERDRLGISDSVRFAGWCDDVVGELAEHDLFVLPSRTEGMPFAVLEAMASGLPVIATDTPGTVEALGGGAFGTIVARDDAMALAGALAAFRTDPHASLDQAQAAAAHVRTRHDLSDCMEHTLACWNTPNWEASPSRY